MCPPNYRFDKRILVKDSDAPEDKKIFVSLISGPYVFKKRKEKGSRITFTCNGCQKHKHVVSAHAWVERSEIDVEDDIYTLDEDSFPDSSFHVCLSTGVEDLVKRFRKDLEASARKEPLQPFPALYQSVRRQYTTHLSYDMKILFLAQIPSYDTVQTNLYRIRREFTPPAPSTQADLNVDLPWFVVSRDREETLVKGDILH